MTKEGKVQQRAKSLKGKSVLTRRSVSLIWSGVLQVAVLAGCAGPHDAKLSSLKYSPSAAGVLGQKDAQFGAYGDKTAKTRTHDGTWKEAAQGNGTDFVVLSPEETERARFVSSSKVKIPESSLVLGFPTNLLNHEHVFGGVVTQVSAARSTDWGDWKLGEVAPILVTPRLARLSQPGQKNAYYLGLYGCESNCDEQSPQNGLFFFPILAADKDAYIVDLTPLGSKLSFTSQLDASRSSHVKSARVVSFEYDQGTLVFDVETLMRDPFVHEALEGEMKHRGAVAEVLLTVRWYLKLSSSFRSNFTARLPTEGIGYFLTERKKAPVVDRFALPSSFGDSSQPVTIHYYVKDMPPTYRPAVQAAFADWNAVFHERGLGDVLSFEFLESWDPRYSAIVTGDVRYHVIEWDTHNAASYGGLGPSQAQPNTGEIFGASVLIQGPLIEDLFHTWFDACEKDGGASTQAMQLARVRGSHLGRLRDVQPDEATFLRELPLHAGAVALRHNARSEKYWDPVSERLDADCPPAGQTYASYMQGYFHDMISHELGHNLGLRHNFRGSLGATGRVVGGVSWSIMEYLDNNDRYLNRVGSYDKMAIGYGYFGIEPNRRDQFCTDEDAAGLHSVGASPECTTMDGTSDPVGNFFAQFRHATEQFWRHQSDVAPWEYSDLRSSFVLSLVGLGLYANASALTFPKWQHFHGLGRPTTSEGVVPYFMEEMKKIICESGLPRGGLTPAQSENFQKLVGKVNEEATDVKVFGEVTFDCGPMKTP